MSRELWCIGLGIGLCFSHLAIDLRAQETKDSKEPRELKVIARFNSSYIPFRLKKGDTGVVIRSAEELAAQSEKPEAAKDVKVQKEKEEALAKLLMVEHIDWNKQMLVAVTGHGSGSGGGIVKFGPMIIEKNAVTIPWQQEDRPSLGIITPSGMILVERFDGEVKFEQMKK